VAAPSATRRDPDRFRARVLEVRSFAEIAREIDRTDSDPEGVGIMTRKARIFPVRLEGVPLRAAPLLKQELLAVGADSAHARGVADHSVETSAVVVLATWGQYRRLLPKLSRQPFQLASIALAIERALANFTSRAPRSVRGVHRSFSVGDRTRVLGVLNVTPDSFSDGGQYLDPDAAVARGRTLLEEGADLLDVGGESTRPGAPPVSPEAEWKRVGPVLDRLAGAADRPISIDTRSPEVARRALDAGADLINDVGGLRDPAMRALAARTGAPVIVMHMRGTPATMQTDTAYADVRTEVYGALADACAMARADGIAPEQLLIDPGLGFGKSADQNLELLAHLGEFRSLGPPVVVGASRKSFLGALTGDAPPTDRLEAGVAAAVVAALAGASLVRTHDVRPTVRALAVADAVGHRGGRLSAEDRWAETDPA
jgi:dihydropteroate synthase